MFDIGGWELFFILIILIAIITPEDMPKVIKFFGHITRTCKDSVEHFQKEISQITEDKSIKNLSKHTTKQVGLSLKETLKLNDKITKKPGKKARKRNG